MYIEKLISWTSLDWNEFFSQFELSENEKMDVKIILTLPNKEEIESHFPRLEMLGIINWIWPWFLMKGTRKFISWLFQWVKYQWHDIMYAIWWIEMERLEVDYWLLKYSYLSVVLFLAQSRARLSPMFMIVIYMVSIMQLSVALFCFIMVITFGRFGSFRYIT